MSIHCILRLPIRHKDIIMWMHFHVEKFGLAKNPLFLHRDKMATFGTHIVLEYVSEYWLLHETRNNWFYKQFKTAISSIA